MRLVRSGPGWTLEDYTGMRDAYLKRPRGSTSLLPNSLFDEGVATKTRLKRKWWQAKEFFAWLLRAAWGWSVSRVRAGFRWWRERDHTSAGPSLRLRFRLWWERNGMLVRSAVAVGGMLTAIVVFLTLQLLIKGRLTKETITVYGNKNPILNVFSPLDSLVEEPPEEWIREHLPLGRISAENITRGYLGCPIHSQEGRMMNVTLRLLSSLFKTNCVPETCDCLSATQMGIGCNVIYLNQFDGQDVHLGGTLLLQPTIVDRSKTKVKLKMPIKGEMKTIEESSDILFEYVLSDGKTAREWLSMREAICVSLVHRLHSSLY